MKNYRRIIQSLCLLAGALLFLNLAGCAQNPVTGKHDFVMLSESSELAIGRSNHPKIIAQYGRYPDERLQAYVQSVGDKLAAVSHRKDLIYRFTVLDSPVINAFALPGGYIYITRGLMAYLNSEAELAAVLGHEIGHVTARHGVRQQSAAQATNLGFTLGSILFPELRGPGTQDIFNILGGALLSGYGREHELESDGLGAEYLARAGYDPNAMMDVIRVLKNQSLFAEAQAKKQGKEVQSYHGLFASHPDNDTRLKEVIASANQYRLKNGDRRRADYLSQIDGLVFGESEEQGIVSGRHFYHGDMNFAVSFPQGWQINNKPTSLQAVAHKGVAVIEMIAEDINRKITPKQFIEQRLEISELMSGRKLDANGLDGYTGLVKNSGRLIRISVVYLANRAFVFFASSKEKSSFSQFDNAFLATAKSLHPLSKQEQKLAQEKRLQVVNVKASDSYQSWAANSRITNSPLLQLKLINGHYPNGELIIGQQAKSIN